jgi:hypothetical protein
MPSVGDIDLSLHFGCEFTVLQQTLPAKTIETCINCVRTWLSRTYKGQDAVHLNKPWIQNQGTWSPTRDRKVTVLVKSLRDDHHNLLHWALRYEHPDAGKAESRYRRWRTDVAVSTDEKGARSLAVRVSHYRLPGHVGIDLDDPQSSSPLLVKEVIGTPQLSCYVDSNPLRTRAIELTDDTMDAFQRSLVDQSRRLPVIYVSREYQSGEAAIDANKLAWVVAGLANVYVAESSWTDKLTERFLPRDYQCWNGMIRVYMPGLDLRKSTDSVRHRYFHPDLLRITGQEQFQLGLVKSLSIRAVSLSTSLVHSIDDVDRFEAQRQLQSLKQRLTSADTAEQIRASYEMYTKEIEKQNNELQAQLNAWQSQSATNQETINKAEGERNYFKSESERLRRDVQDISVAQTAFLSLSKLPQTKTACGEFFATAFPLRLCFTDRAKVSLRDDPFDDVEKVWNALWHMCNTLWPMLFEKRHDDFAKEFERISTFELTMTEGEQTKNQKRMMKEREDVFRGKSIDITPHVKLFHNGQYARIYFHIDSANRLLVVGFFGHLTTAGTAKRK